MIRTGHLDTPERIAWATDRAVNHADADCARMLLHAFALDPANVMLAAYVASCVREWLPKASKDTARAAFNMRGPFKGTDRITRALIIAMHATHGPDTAKVLEQLAIHDIAIGERQLFKVVAEATDDDRTLASLLIPSATIAR